MRKAYWSNNGIIFFAFLIILYSCGSSRLMTKGGNLTGVSERSFKKDFEDNYLTPEFLVGKAKVKYKDEDQGLSFTMQLRMIKDEAIWISGTFLGFEVARVLITPDSLKAINKYEKTYTLRSMNDLKEEFDVDQLDFGLIQDLFLGNDLMPENPIDSFAFDSLAYVIKKRQNEYVQTARINQVFEMTNIQLYGRDKLIAQVDQEEFKPFSNKNISYFRKYIINKDNTKSTSIQLDFNALSEEKPKSIPFRIPDNYEYTD